MVNYIEEIEEFNREYVHIKDRNKVNEIIRNLVTGGYEKLQVVSDFDQTLTKQHENGKKHLSSFAMFSRCPSVTEEHKMECSRLAKKYGPLEFDPTIPNEEKRKYMEEWWVLSEVALRGLQVTPEEIQNICSSIGPSLRNGTKEFFSDLYDADVPVLVFSAGLGDIVKAVLNHCDVLLPNVETVSNFLKYDEEGTITGFKNNIIHVFNKNEYAIKGTEFYNKVLDRDNVILMGDTVGDATMVEGIDHLKSVLKIGFLYDRYEESLPSYMDTFDIVLVDDQTMDIPRAILNIIKSAKRTELGTQ